MSLYINPNVNIREAVEFGVGVPPQSLVSEKVYQSDWEDIAQVRRAVGVALLQNLSDTKTLHVYFRQAKDSTGTSAKDLGDEVTITADGEQDVMAAAEIRETDIDTANDFNYISVAVYHDDGSGLYGSLVVGTEPYRRNEDLVDTEAVSYNETTSTP